MEWSDPQEREDALTLSWGEFRKRYPHRTRNGFYGFRADWKRGLRRNPNDVEGDVERPIVLSTTVPATEQAEFPVGSKKGAKKLTIAFGDTHLGDQGLLYECFLECRQASVDLAKQQKPDEIELALVGDGASGRGIFRNQELRNVLPLAQPQVLWLAWEIKDWFEALRSACPKATATGKNVHGHHDFAMGENLAYVLPIVLYLFGIPWKYCGRQAVLNLAAEGETPFLALIEHGYGHSSYYANSYAQIRGTWQEVLDMDRRNEGHPIQRVIAGHTHWLNIGHYLAPGRFLDTVGGFQRQDRMNLPPTGRPAGFIAYAHDGKTMTVKSITPKQETVDRLTDDQALDLRNGALAFQQLLRVREYLQEKGLVL